MARRFPQLLRTADHRWWKPLAGVLCAAILLVAFGIAVVLATIGLVAVSDSNDDPFSREALNAATPLGLLGNNLTLAMITPAVLLTVVIVHRQRPGLLASVEGRLRWPFLGRLLLIALALSSTAYVVTLWLLPQIGDTSDRPSLGLLLSLLLVVLLSTPLQAAGEEFGFRGYLTQAFASWFARPGFGAAVAAGITALLFALAHGVQDPWLFADRLMFGLAASWLVWRTGGLEAAIALHAANNLVALGSAVVTGELEVALGSTALDWRYAVSDLATIVVFSASADRLAARRTVATVSGEMPVGYPDKRLKPPASPDG